MGILHIGKESALKLVKTVVVESKQLASSPLVQPEIKAVEHAIEVIKEVPVEVVREVRVEVPVEVIKYIDRPIEVLKEVIKEVPVEVTKEIQVVKEVIKEIPVEIEKLVRVPFIQLKWRTPRWAWFAIGIITLELMTIIKLLLNK